MAWAEAVFGVILLALYRIQRSRIPGWTERMAVHTSWSMTALFLLPVVLRLLLLVRYPVPSPYVSDDFVQILSADTLLHFRLSNPAHPFHRFFETFFTLQEPTYSAMFPPGQGLNLALGKMITGHYWGGVVIATGALSALSYWMLRAWVSPSWALLGGILTATQFGPLSEWMNSYWGGSLAASAGCLVFGALPRLRSSASARNALVLGAGLALHALIRPFESLFLLAATTIFLGYAKTGLPPRKLVWALPPLVAALGLTLLHNHAVTGRWTTLPYQLSLWEYGVPTNFAFQPNPEPHRELTREQQLVLVIQKERHGERETPSTYFQRLGYRMRYIRFFVLAPLYLVLPFFLPSVRQLRYFWVAGTICLFFLGSNFYPYFFPHYIAGITCLFVLVTVTGLRRLAQWNVSAARWLVSIAVAHFLFWYGVLAFASPRVLEAVKPFATWHVINIGDPEGRISMRKQLEAVPGDHLVFVRYWALHTFREWAHNEADIDHSRIIWARDRGGEEDLELIRHYPNRKAWLLEPDARPPRLRPYDAVPATTPFQSLPYRPEDSRNGSR